MGTNCNGVPIQSEQQINTWAMVIKTSTLLPEKGDLRSTIRYGVSSKVDIYPATVMIT